MLGVFIGLLIAVAIFFFRVDSYFSKLNSFFNKKDTVIIEKQIPVEIPTEEKQNKTGLNYSVNKNETDKVNSADTFAQKYKRGASLKYLMAQSDSLLKDSTIEKVNVSYEQEESIIVKKDEMIAMRTIAVVNVPAHEEVGAGGQAVAGDNIGQSKTDSLLQAVSGIHDDSKNIIASFKVELWQSPVNYKGYKMGKNKIVLFGVKEEDEVKIYKIDDEIYLKHNQNYYRMDYTNEFRAFERVSNQGVLVKLK